ncbi:hypothetical protein BDN72DRAFT_840044 [Pluteus cervinus]|uniref:Uncharacterized protein n=1 Tax=Pluteus cervinus TaxID=181527 RepID=A0ACD3AV88_9AGAR|nr:hypothetical protein BDN72DRAFT_840044 [Pluteus cervinus]
MLSLGKFTAWIEVNGEHLPEFGPIVSDDSETVSCWVPSEAGKEFAVCWNDSNLEYVLDGCVEVDGKWCGSSVWRLQSRMGTPVSSRIKGVRTGPFTRRALVFSNIDLTDDDTYLQASSSAEDLGEIIVRLRESVITGTGTLGDQSSPFPDDMKLHERSKKGMGHRIGLGEESTAQNSNSVHTKKIRTVATFIFRYRPLAILQANGIAPVDRSQKRKASTPPEEPSEDEEDKAAAAELEALKARIREIEGRQKKRIKTEVKTEPISNLELRPPKNLGVIDLTDLD